MFENMNILKLGIFFLVSLLQLTNSTKGNCSFRKSSDSSKEDDRIIGGFPIEITKAPYQVSLSVVMSHFCGGSIIAPGWVITAGHCAEYGENAQGVLVRAGSKLHRTGGQISAVEQFIIHEKFREPPNKNRNDIALLKLKKPFKLNDFVKTIKLPAQNQQLKQGLKVKISGWGVYSKEGSIETADSSTNLMAAYVLVMNFKKCKDNYKRYGVNVDETVQMCTGLKRGGRDSCKGDSGGPVNSETDQTLVGVISIGISCAEKNLPGINTRVSGYRDWIKENSGI